jgi:hypothetical protein
VVLAVATAVVVGPLVGIPAAFAAVPTVTSFNPTSGPVGTSVTIMGTEFTNTSTVTFNGTSATTVTFGSATQITATVPAGATTGPIAVANGDGTGTSASSFTVTPGAVPTITSFTPTSGVIGTVVTITGTNLTGATQVKFNTTVAPTFTVNSVTQITATVPATAVTGPIGVTTSTGTGTSSTNFTVTSTTTVHDRDVTLSLHGHLKARGRVTSDLDACESGVRVKIQRRSHGWKTVKRATTNNAGRYVAEIRDRDGRYRAIVTSQQMGPNDTCAAARSPIVQHG